jgi:hypothetical protein
MQPNLVLADGRTLIFLDKKSARTLLSLKLLQNRTMINMRGAD